jgi:putative endonuclease
VNKLVYYESFDYIDEAIYREKCIKEWHRKWKIELIKENNKEWKDLFYDLASEEYIEIIKNALKEEYKNGYRL